MKKEDDGPRLATVAFRRGGAGKSSISIMLSTLAAALDLKVLLVDADTQASATNSLYEFEDLNYNTLYELLEKKEKIDNCIYPSIHENLDIIPSKPAICSLDRTLSRNPYKTLRPILKKLEQYDLILIDQSPAFGRLNEACYCVDNIIIPACPDVFSLESIVLSIEDISYLSNEYGFESPKVDIVLNKFSPRMKASQDAVSFIKNDKRVKKFFKQGLTIKHEQAFVNTINNGRLIWDSKNFNSETKETFFKILKTIIPSLKVKTTN